MRRSRPLGSGYKKLNKALELAKAEGLDLDVSLRYDPFELDPTLTDEPVSKRERYAQKFGADRFEGMLAQMVERGREYGIEFSYGGDVSQTTRPARLLAYAFDKGGWPLQRAVLEPLFAGYFEHERTPSDVDWLATVAVDAGIFPTADEAAAWLRSDAGVAEYKAAIDRARREGISGVPATVIQERYLVPGGQDPEVFLGAFKRAVAARPAA
jgi:predicted DsbA family dithiol-disulfide isomerase